MAISKMNLITVTDIYVAEGEVTFGDMLRINRDHLTGKSLFLCFLLGWIAFISPQITWWMSLLCGAFLIMLTIVSLPKPEQREDILAKNNKHLERYHAKEGI